MSDAFADSRHADTAYARQIFDENRPPATDVEHDPDCTTCEPEPADECGAEYVTGGSDPYATDCDRAPGHAGAHQGVDPFDTGDRITWRGGGTAGGDRLPISRVTRTYLPGDRA